MGADDCLTPPSLPPEGAARLLDHVFQIWIDRTIAERHPGFQRGDVTKALVVLSPAKLPLVRINDEVELVASVRATRSLEAGEPVTLADFDAVRDLRPKDIDPNAGSRPDRPTPSHDHDPTGGSWSTPSPPITPRRDRRPRPHRPPDAPRHGQPHPCRRQSPASPDDNRYASLEKSPPGQDPAAFDKRSFLYQEGLSADTTSSDPRPY